MADKVANEFLFFPSLRTQNIFATLSPDTMFKGGAAELLGRADVCAVLRPGTKEWSEAASTAFLMSEDGEVPLFVLKSKQDEYVFTDRSFVHLDGNSALSKKRLVLRYPYCTHEISQVMVETAGTIDYDCEIKFSVAGRAVSIDVEKKELPAIIALYKALVAIAEIQARGNRQFELAKLALQRGTESLSKTHGLAAAAATPPSDPSHPMRPGAVLIDAADGAYSWLSGQWQSTNQSNFGEVIMRYIGKLPPQL